MASNFSAEREKAKAEGLTFFYCDKPCKRGHVAKRYVSSGNCHECRLTEEFRARRRELRPKYKEHLQEKDKVRKAQGRKRIGSALARRRFNGITLIKSNTLHRCGGGGEAIRQPPQPSDTSDAL